MIRTHVTALVLLFLMPGALLVAAPATQKNFATFVGGIGDLVQGIIFIIAAMAVLAFLWGLASNMMGVGDDPKKLQQAKDFMLYGIIGFAVMGSMYAILSILKVTVTSTGV